MLFWSVLECLRLHHAWWVRNNAFVVDWVRWGLGEDGLSLIREFLYSFAAVCHPSSSEASQWHTVFPSPHSQPASLPEFPPSVMVTALMVTGLWFINIYWGLPLCWLPAGRGDREIIGPIPSFKEGRHLWLLYHLQSLGRARTSSASAASPLASFSSFPSLP